MNRRRKGRIHQPEHSWMGPDLSANKKTTRDIRGEQNKEQYLTMMTCDADKRVHLAGDRDMWLEVWQRSDCWAGSWLMDGSWLGLAGSLVG